MVLYAALIVYFLAALHFPGILAGLQSGHSKLDHLFRLLASMLGGSPIVALLGAATGLLLLFGFTAWRWADETAIRANRRGLEFHRSLRRQSLAWEQIASVTFIARDLGGTLQIGLHDGSIQTISGLSASDGLLFAEKVRGKVASLNRPAVPAIPPAT